MADDGGLARFQRRMRAIPAAVRDAVRPALEQAAEEICDLARSLCPVDDGVLRASIGWTWGLPPSGSIALGAVRDGAALSITIYAGNDEAFYARFVEFGTRTGVPAQPFFYPAWRLGRKKASARLNRAISKAIREAR